MSIRPEEIKNKAAKMKHQPYQAVVLAGGRGTRLRPFTDENPKPLYPVHGKPFLLYLLEQIRDFGIREVVLLLGYQAEKIIELIGDGASIGLQVIYSVTPVECETGTRIRNAKELLKEEFLLLYCDNYCPIDFWKAYDAFQRSGSLIQVTAYANRDGYTKNNLTVQEGQITCYDKKRLTAGLNGVDIGYAFMKREALDFLPEGNLNFEAAVYPRLVAKGQMGGYLTQHRYYSIGSWERMKLTEEFLRKRKVVFLDRDGTLNVKPKRAEYIERPEDFVWLPGAKEAVALLKKKGYEVYLISNQPGIARGRLTEEMLEEIHKKMLKELREAGGDLDGLYICPHGWNDGCDCRKPRPGMLYQAQKEHSLNLRECFFIGDDDRDMEAGEAAEVKHCIRVSERYTLFDAVKEL